MSRAHVMLGLDAATGRELWRSKTLAQPSTSEAGIVGRYAYQEGSDGDLTIFDVRNGKPTVTRAGRPNLGRVPRTNLQVDAASGRVFHSLERMAVLLDPGTGKVVWSRALPDDAIAIIAGIGGGDQPITVVILDPKTGAPQDSVTVPAHAYVHADPGGGFYVNGPILTGYNRDGAERAHISPVDPPNLSAGVDYAALFSKDDLAILGRADLKRVGALRGSYAVQDGSSLATTLLLYRYIDEGKRPGEAILLAPSAP
jgi:outer membrane protein assembly factor BamB